MREFIVEDVYYYYYEKSVIVRDVKTSERFKAWIVEHVDDDTNIYVGARIEGNFLIEYIRDENLKKVDRPLMMQKSLENCHIEAVVRIIRIYEDYFLVKTSFCDEPILINPSRVCEFYSLKENDVLYVSGALRIITDETADEFPYYE